MKIVFRVLIAITMLAMVSTAQIDQVTYDGDMERIQGDQQYIADLVYGLQDNLTALQSSGVKTADKDTVTIDIGNGTLAMSNVSSINKDVQILAEGGSVAWDESGATAARSYTPDAGASADSQVGNEAIKTPARRTAISTSSNPVVLTPPALPAATVNSTVATTTQPAFASEQAYQDWIDGWVASASVGETLAISTVKEGDLKYPYPRTDATGMNIIPDTKLVVTSPGQAAVQEE